MLTLETVRDALAHLYLKDDLHLCHHSARNLTANQEWAAGRLTKYLNALLKENNNEPER